MVVMENPTCIARLMQFKVAAFATQPRFHHIQHLNEVTVGRHFLLLSRTSVQNGWSMSEVCASPSTERVHFYSCDEGI